MRELRVAACNVKEKSVHLSLVIEKEHVRCHKEEGYGKPESGARETALFL